MRKCLAAPTGTLSALLALAFAASAPAFAQNFPDAVPDELLVTVRPQVSTATVRQTYSEIGTTVSRQPALHVLRLKLRSGVTMQSAVAQLKQKSGVVCVEPNYRYHTASVPNDPAYSSQYGPRIVQAEQAWSIWRPKAKVVVAVLDTGLDTSHPDVAGKVLRDQIGVVGYDAVRRQLTDGPNDFEGHGTHCAGIAAAQVNNGVGIAGIAGWDGISTDSDTSYVNIMPVKVLDDVGNGTAASVSDGIVWAADNGAKVLSLSLAGPAFSATVDNAIQYAWGKGCLIVAAAGNSGGTAKSYPAAYNNVIAVAGTTASDALASWSNFGDWVQVAAPGDGIYSTTPTYQMISGVPSNYATLSGTSMACPHVSGEAALIWSQNPSLTNAQVRSLIVSNVDPYTGPRIAPGGGRINVFKALQAAIATGTVSAVVLDRNRQPIAGAEVHLYDLDGQQFLSNSVVSGSDGAAVVPSIPAGRYHIGAYKTGYNPWIFSPYFQGWQVTAGQTTGPIEIVLDSTSALNAGVFGFVRYDDATGAHPIGSGVHIDVYSGGHLVASTDSDANGHYQVNGLNAIAGWWGWYTYIATWNGHKAVGVNFGTWGGVPIRMDIPFQL